MVLLTKTQWLGDNEALVENEQTPEDINRFSMVCDGFLYKRETIT